MDNLKASACAEVATRSPATLRPESIMTTFNDTTALSTVNETSIGSSDMDWPARIEHYHKVIGRSAYMSYEDGWAYGVWFLGNSWAV